MGRDYSTVVFRVAVTKNCMPPICPNAYYTEVEFLFPVSCRLARKKTHGRIAAFWVHRLKWIWRWKPVDYLLGLPITRTIPGLRLAKFPLVSFKASTVVLWDLAIEESVSPRCTL